MDSREAIPSGDDPVVIPDHLLERLRAAAERKLAEACDSAFPPDGRDDVIAAVHLLDGFTGHQITAKMARELIPSAIEFEEPVEVPRTRAGLEAGERQLARVRELLELAERLGGDGR
jgi:hypothetical protein